MKVLKSLVYTAFFTAVVFSLNSCGSSVATTTTEATSAEAQASSALTSSLSTSLTSSTTSATASTTEAVNLVRSMVRTRAVLAATETTEDSFSSTTDCLTSGTLVSAGDFSMIVDTDTYASTIDATLTETFDACVDNATFTTSDNASCAFTTAIDGLISCNMSGSFDGSDDSAAIDFAFACSTSSACDGLTVTLNGEVHTVGMDLSATITSTSEDPALTGTLCIDGDNIDLATLAELETLDSTEAVCE